MYAVYSAPIEFAKINRIRIFTEGNLQKVQSNNDFRVNITHMNKDSEKLFERKGQFAHV